MRRQVAALGVVAIVAVAAVGWNRRPLADAPGAATPVVAEGPLLVVLEGRSVPVPRQDVRRSLSAALPAETGIGRWVQAAMDEPGDSDPRLLDALLALGIRPIDLAPTAAAVDPWLAVGLVDLERQVARRCGPACREDLLEAEERVAEALTGGVGELAVAALRDQDAGSPRTIVAGGRGWAAAIASAARRCDPGGPLAVELHGAYDGGGWRISGPPPLAGCLADSLSGPVPEEPLAVSILLYRVGVDRAGG